jgi:Flp pilus assembly protein TadD
MCVCAVNRLFVVAIFFAASLSLSGCGGQRLSQTTDGMRTGSIDAANSSNTTGATNVSAETFIKLAEASASTGDYEAADKALARAIEIDPKSVAAHLALARSLLNQERLDEALDMATKAQHLDKDSAEAQLVIGKVYFARGQIELSRQAFEKAVALEPKNSAALNALGVTLDTQGNYAEAQVLYKKALTISPSLTAARNNLGLSLALAGHAQDAISALRTAASTRQNEPKIMQNLALAYALNGEEDKATELYNRFLQDEDTATNLQILAPRKAAQNPAFQE